MKHRVLIVDDNATNLKLARDVLEFDGFQVKGADSAERALQMLASFPADLVLMDLAMPGMDGLELTRKLRSDTATRHLIIVALTASAMRGDETKAIDAGCDGYITKPISTRTFSAQVAAYLTGPGRPAAE